MEKDSRILKQNCLGAMENEMIFIDKKAISKNKEELLRRTIELYEFLKSKGFTDADKL